MATRPGVCVICGLPIRAGQRVVSTEDGRAQLRGRMGQAGRERIREHFTWPAVTDLTIQAYEDALAG